MQPLRPLEKLNATVVFSPRRMQLHLNFHDGMTTTYLLTWHFETDKIMWLDKKDFMLNGTSNEMDVAPVSINNRTMVPVRFAAESSGCTVEWLNNTQQIVVVFYLQ